MRGRRAGGGALLLVSLAAAVPGGWAEWAYRAEAPAVEALVHTALSVVGLGWAAAGAALVWLRPRNALGWLMVVVGTGTQLGLTEESFARIGLIGDPSTPHPWDGRAVGFGLSVLVGFLIFALLGLLPVLYPSGRLPGRGRLGPPVALVVGAALLQAQWYLSEVGGPWGLPGSADGEPTLLAWLRWAPAALYAAATLVVWVMAAVRLARAHEPERQQLAWLLVAVVVLLLTQLLGTSVVALWAQALGLYLLPAAIAVGVLRYRLLGIEVVLRRGLVYSTLTVAIVALHAGSTALAGVRLSGAVVPGIVAATIVAVGLTPLRTWLERLVDRFLFGARGDPLAAVTDLGQRVATAEPHALLDAVLIGVQAAVRAAGARVEDAHGTVLGSAGEAVGEGAALVVPLTVGGVQVGTLHLGPRGPGERYTPHDRRLAAAMAPQVAVVVRALALAEDVQAQRDAVLTARVQERERLRSDLHDGLGPSLTGVGLGLQALDDALRAADTPRARELTAVLRSETATTVGEVHRILDGLGPAALAEHGLEAAIVRGVSSATTPIPVEVDLGALPPLPAEVEDAIYRVALESVTNVLRHAGAQRAAVRVHAVPGGVVLRVVDDGQGFPSPSTLGIGLVSMRERARSIGGSLEVDTGASGTTVTMRVPLPAPAGAASMATVAGR